MRITHRSTSPRSITHPVVASLALVVAVLGVATASATAAQDAGIPSVREAERAVAEGNGDLRATPPARDTARAAFERATFAGDAPVAVAEAFLHLATLDEEDGEFARALANDKAAVAAAPHSRFAHSARERIGWLSARSDGGFEPLARLERLRKSPGFADDPAVIEALARDAEAFPPSLVRAEARLIVGEAWLKRLHRREDGIDELRKVLDDPSTIKMNKMNVAQVQRDIVEALIAGGQLDEAAREVHRRAMDPSLVEEVDGLVHRRALWRGAAGVLVTFACVVAVLLMLHVLRRAARAA